MTKHNLTSDPDWKRCSECKQYFPRTTEYFHKCKYRVDGLNNWCKACRHKHQLSIRAAKHDYDQIYVALNYEKITERNHNYRLSNADEIKRRKREAYQRNRIKVLAKQREYNSRPDKRDQRNRTANLAWHRRRARLLSLPVTFTAQDWQRALDYFGGCCAICGSPPGLWHVIAKEHWISLNDPREDNPGTVPTNILPMCHSRKHGEGGCNNLKGDADPVEWLIQRLGRGKAAKKLKEIEAYFEWVKAHAR